MRLKTHFSTKNFEKNQSVAMDKPHSWHVSEKYSNKYFRKYCENAESVQHGPGLPYSIQDKNELKLTLVY